MQGVLSAVLLHVPALHQVRIGALGPGVLRESDAVVAVRGHGVLERDEVAAAHVQGAAVGADLAPQHQRFQRQPVLDRRQLALAHELRQLRRFLEGSDRLAGGLLECRRGDPVVGAVFVFVVEGPFHGLHLFRCGGVLRARGEDRRRQDERCHEERAPSGSSQ